MKKSTNFLSKKRQVEQAYRLRSKTDFMLFTRGLTIASQAGPQVFERCMANFQRECYEELAISLEAVRTGQMPPIRRFWIERTKKAAKDSDLAVIIIWLVGFPIRPLYLQVGAADREQASIVKERITHLLHWNEWLNDHVELVQNEVRSKARLQNGSVMAKLDIMSSDVAGAHGGTPDLLIVNELSHVTKWEFVENLMDNADGVSQGMVILATNAGFKGTKAEVWRNNALSSDDWAAHIVSKPAPWHSLATIEDAKARGNTKSRFERLWRGKWVSGKGDALDESDIEKCFDQNGPVDSPENGWRYIGGLDLGISHDHSAFMILGVNIATQKLRTAWWKAWIPKKGGEVDLIEIESIVLGMGKHYRVEGVYFDPYQAKLMAQRIKRQGIAMREMSFSKPGNLNRMAATFIQAVEEQKLSCYDDEDNRLSKDFAKFNIAEKPYGYKLEAVSDEMGHADVGTALVICLPPAFEILEGVGGFMSDDVLVLDDDDAPLTQDEIEDMPVELRDIYEIDFEDIRFNEMDF